MNEFSELSRSCDTPKLLTNRLEYFDFLRACAILFIIVGHIPQYLINDGISQIFSPYITIFGMSLFVFISGYLIYQNNSTIKSYKDILHFYKKRIVRIFPLYLIAIIFYYIVFAILIPHFAPQYTKPDLSTLYGATNIFSHITGTQVLLSPMISTPLPALSFIGLIMLFYFIYPILIYLSKDVKRFFAYAILLLAFFCVVRLSFNIIDNRVFNYYLIFIFGVISCYANIFVDKKYSRFLIYIPIIFILSLLFNIRLGSLLELGYSTSITTLLNLVFIVDGGVVMMVSFSIICLLFAKDFTIKGGIENRGFGAISTASYPAFLFHTPIFYLGYGVTYFLNFSPIIHNVFIIFIVVPFIFILSYFIQKYENKFWRNKLDWMKF